jgi:hypothetical protein
VRAAAAAGISPDRVILDPGIGFGKRGAQNELRARRVVALGAGARRHERSASPSARARSAARRRSLGCGRSGADAGAPRARMPRATAATSRRP